MPRDSRYTSLSGAPPSPELDQQQPTGLQPPDQATGLPDYAGNMGEGLSSLAGVEPPLQKLSTFSAFSKVQSDMAENTQPMKPFTIDPVKKTLKGEIPMDIWQALQRDRAQLNEIRGSFAQEAAKLKAQEEAAQRMPWYVRLAQGLSANIAQQPNMPGWVQAAGRTSAQLNPMPEQIRAQRLALMKEEASLAEQGLRLGEAAQRQQELRDYHRMEEARRNEGLEQKKKDAFNKPYEKMALDKRTAPDEKAYIAARRQRFPNETAEEAKIEYDKIADMATKTSAEQEQERAQKEADKAALVKLKTSGQKDLLGTRHAYAQAEIAQRIMGSMEHLEKAQEFNKAQKELGVSITQDKALSVVPVPEKRRLVDLTGITRYVNSTRELLALPEMQGYEGPLTPERLLPRFAQSPNLVKYNEWINQELPRINSMVKGGVRMISSPQGRDFVKSKLGFTEHMTRAQIEGILDNADQIVSNERRSIIDAFPLAWKPYPELLGKDYEYAMMIGGAPRPGAGGPPRTSGAAPVAPPSDPEFRKALSGLKPGKVLNDGTHRWKRGPDGNPVLAD